MDEKMLRQAGYVPLSEFDDSGRRSNDGHAPRYKTLKKALDKGEKSIPSAQIPAVKYGRFWVHKDSAERFLSEAEAAASAAISQASTGGDDFPSVQSSPGDDKQLFALLQSALVVLDRIATAVESIATQPQSHHEPVGSWRDMNNDEMN
jgi:hypothetical protein